MSDVETIYLLKVTDYAVFTAAGKGPLRQTTKSWVVDGLEKWSETKYLKKDYRVVTKAEYDEAVWCIENRYKISQGIYNTQNLKLIRAVADLIGYKEETK